jgi:hypothetical protein
VERAVDGQERTGHADALLLLEDLFANPIPSRFGPVNLGVSIVHLSAFAEKGPIALRDSWGAELRQERGGRA